MAGGRGRVAAALKAGSAGRSQCARVERLVARGGGPGGRTRATVGVAGDGQTGGAITARLERHTRVGHLALRVAGCGR